MGPRSVGVVVAASTNGQQQQQQQERRRSLSQEMQSRQERALDWERQLEAVIHKNTPTNKKNFYYDESSSTAANRIRIPLCELLADMMLTDPRQALLWDVDQRLWRHCFYSRIVPLRAQIAKKNKKAKASHDNSAQLLEQSLQLLLAEAVTLYQFMAQNLTDKLQGKDTTTTPTQSQPHYDEQQLHCTPDSSVFETALPLETKDGIVETLHRIYIRLGDLFRYSTTGAHLNSDLPYNKAQSYYQLAAALGPGHGHAFNQIAVVCQTSTTTTNATPAKSNTAKNKQQTAVALYWYARSLWAATAPFETARANILRLFQDNQEWLIQHPASESSLIPPSNKNAVPPVLQSKQCLAEFVDLHRYFFVRQDSTTLYKTMQQFMDKQLASLLQVSALGDSLLVKLVCIHAFSEWNCRQPDPATPSRPNNHALFSWAARTATYQFGARMADKILIASLKTTTAGTKTTTTSASQQSKANVNNKQPSVRLLLPLLLLTEYVINNDTISALMLDEKGNASTDSSSSSKAQQRHDEARQAFWERMVLVWNQVALQFASLMTENGHDAEDENKASLELFQDLVGFGPFESFLRVPCGGFVPDEQAILVLTDTTNNNNNSSGKNNGPSSPLFLARRLLRVAEAAAQADPRISKNIDTGIWEWQSQQPQCFDHDMDEPMLPPPLPPNDDAMEEEECTETNKDDVMQQEEEKDQKKSWLPSVAELETKSKISLEIISDNSTTNTDKDVLMYQTGLLGGPPLLVPGALLGSNSQRDNDTSGELPNDTVVADTNDMNHILFGSPGLKAPPPGIAPPPGFESMLGSTTTTTPTPGGNYVAPNRPSPLVGVATDNNTSGNNKQQTGLFLSGSTGNSRAGMFMPTTTTATTAMVNQNNLSPSSFLINPSSSAVSVNHNNDYLTPPVTVQEVLSSYSMFQQQPTQNPFAGNTFSGTSLPQQQELQPLAANLNSTSLSDSLSFLDTTGHGEMALFDSDLFQSMWGDVVSYGGSKQNGNHSNSATRPSTRATQNPFAL